MAEVVYTQQMRRFLVQQANNAISELAKDQGLSAPAVHCLDVMLEGLTTLYDSFEFEGEGLRNE